MPSQLGRHCRAGDPSGRPAGRRARGRRGRLSDPAALPAEALRGALVHPPGLNAAFAWARDISGARIATTSTRQYPLFGTDLSNRVQYLGAERPHGGFEAPTTCRGYRRHLNEGDYDYVIATRDRIEAGKPPSPAQTDWTEGAGARVILKKPPTMVFELRGRLDPAVCS